MGPIRSTFACLMVVLMVTISLSLVHGSSYKKRNTHEIRVQSQETDGVDYRERSPGNNDDDSADQEENDNADGNRKVRKRARNVFQVFLEIHSHNARNKKSNSKKFSDRSRETFVTVYDSRRAKKNGKEKRESPTFVHVVAVPPGRFNVNVGYNRSGVINGTWRVAAQNGSVHFNEETSLIEIERDGFYSFYASIYYKYRTALAMSHCVGVIKDGEIDDERKSCATSASSYRYVENTAHWGHSSTNFAKGVYYLRRGDLVGVRMNASEIAPESNAIAFVPDQCYFGVERM